MMGSCSFPRCGDGRILDAAIIGGGVALLYPTLIAAMGDIAHPAWRGSALGVYRFWCDLGYAIDALAMGVIADALGMLEAGFWLTSAAMALSGFWLDPWSGRNAPPSQPRTQSVNLTMP